MYQLKEQLDFDNPTKVVYISENPDEDNKGYTTKDFVEIAKGNMKLVQIIFDLCQWQHPETVLDEMEREREVDEKGNILI